MQNLSAATRKRVIPKTTVAKALESDRYRIAFLSQENPTDKRTWSGITYHLHRQMSRFHEVTWVHAADLSLTQRRILSLWNRMMNAMSWKFTSHYILNAFFLGRKLQKKLAREQFDFIVVGAGESELIAYLKTKVPVIYIADTTFANMVDYYPWHTGLSKLALRQGNRVEGKAIQKATHLIYTSAWAADSAVSHYNAHKDRISILSFGANLSRIPEGVLVNAKVQGPQCRLLFLGVQWERKGGPMVHQTFLQLKRRGLDCSLTIIGCTPPLPPDKDLRIIPFLDKNDKEQGSQLFDILMNTDLLFVPTRADCTPVVFSEAAAFGVPVITSQTGGIGSVIKEGINGYCLPLAAKAVDYADLIEKTWLNKTLYAALKVSARAEYDNRLNWEIWIASFNKTLRDL